MLSPLMQKLIEALRYLPSVGPKSAQRMAFYLLSERGQARGLTLTKVLQDALEKIGLCQRCQTFTEESLCTLCNHPKRRKELLCVVETPADIIAIEQASMYAGLYFVLHGRLSPLDGIGPKEIGIPKLLHRLTEETIEELILATNPTIEGKATANYIASQVDVSKTKCTRIAHGVPLGGELEYLDSGTLTHAFHSRTEILE